MTRACLNFSHHPGFLTPTSLALLQQEHTYIELTPSFKKKSIPHSRVALFTNNLLQSTFASSSNTKANRIAPDPTAFTIPVMTETSAWILKTRLKHLQPHSAINTGLMDHLDFVPTLSTSHKPAFSKFSSLHMISRCNWDHWIHQRLCDPTTFCLSVYKVCAACEDLQNCPASTCPNAARCNHLSVKQ